uniref:Zinc finger protein 655 n=1 Tax=Prolemur simus TaxID=1328070 RepID=A0A8C8YZ65_PROSS
MEEPLAQEAAGSPRIQFQSLETQSEGLSPEPQFIQDTDMEEGLTGAPPVPQVPALPHEGSPGDQAAALMTARYQCYPWGGSLPTEKVFRVFSIPGSLIFIGILLRLPITRIHSVNSCPALSHTQASAFSGETLAVLKAGISKRWPKCRLPIDIARPCSETPFPRL